MIKAVLFDMNGIIIDDEHIHEKAFRETVKPFGINLSRQAYLNCCAGKTDKAGYEQIAKNFSVKLPIDDLLQKKSQMYLELFPVNKKYYPGITDLIHTLAKNFTLALTSSSSRKEVDLITKELGIDHEFKLTISADEVTKGKPNPEPYLITTKKLKLKPNECVVVEDSPSGVLSAKTAGCYCIGVTTTHSKKDLKRADLVVNSFPNISAETIQNFPLNKL